MVSFFFRTGKKGIAPLWTFDIIIQKAPCCWGPCLWIAVCFFLGTTGRFFLSFVFFPPFYSPCGRSVEVNKHGSGWRGRPAWSHNGIIKGELTHVRPRQTLPPVSARSPNKQTNMPATEDPNSHTCRARTNTRALTPLICLYAYSSRLRLQGSPAALECDLLSRRPFSNNGGSQTVSTTMPPCCTGWCGAPLSSFSYLGIRSLVQLIN